MLVGERLVVIVVLIFAVVKPVKQRCFCCKNYKLLTLVTALWEMVGPWSTC